MLTHLLAETYSTGIALTFPLGSKQVFYIPFGY